MKTVTVTIGTDGKVKVHAQGFVGKDCEQATKDLLDGLGRTVRKVATAEAAQVKHGGARCS